MYIYICVYVCVCVCVCISVWIYIYIYIYIWSVWVLSMSDPLPQTRPHTHRDVRTSLCDLSVYISEFVLHVYHDCGCALNFCQSPSSSRATSTYIPEWEHKKEKKKKEKRQPNFSLHKMLVIPLFLNLGFCFPSLLEDFQKLICLGQIEFHYFLPLKFVSLLALD